MCVEFCDVVRTSVYDILLKSSCSACACVLIGTEPWKSAPRVKSRMSSQRQFYYSNRHLHNRRAPWKDLQTLDSSAFSSLGETPWSATLVLDSTCRAGGATRGVFIAGYSDMLNGGIRGSTGMLTVDVATSLMG